MVNNMKAEIKSSGFISKMIPFFGMFMRGVVMIPHFRRTIGVMNKSFGRLLPNLSFLGFRKEASYENAVWNWELFLKLIGASYDVGETTSESRCYSIKGCPAGYCNLKHLDACKVTMEIDNSLVERSGARLIVDKRFPTDGVCVERLVPK